MWLPRAAGCRTLPTRQRKREPQREHYIDRCHLLARVPTPCGAARWQPLLHPNPAIPSCSVIHQNLPYPRGTWHRFPGLVMTAGIPRLGSHCHTALAGYCHTRYATNTRLSGCNACAILCWAGSAAAALWHTTAHHSSSTAAAAA